MSISPNSTKILSSNIGYGGNVFPSAVGVHIQQAENHTSWTYTQNSVYDTFQGENHTAYRADPGVIASFSNNVYFNPYGTLLLFENYGQDNGSVLADPLFVGEVNQCDFFTVQSDSPAAQLGFVNLTKLPQWTSAGCDMDDGIDNKQFYHW